MAESLTKEFYKLMKDIKGMSDGQAKLLDWNDEDVSSFKVEIAPNGGPYHGGKFMFKVELGDSFPDSPPAVVHCETKIYHPNINQCGSTRGTNVCLNLFSGSNWLQLTKPGIENVIQGLLFLFYEPNIHDPLSPEFHSTQSWESFLKNVKLSLSGKDKEDEQYSWNFGDCTHIGERYPWNSVDGTIETTVGNGTSIEDTIKSIVGIGLTNGVPMVFKREANKMFDENRTISFNAFHADMPRTDSVFNLSVEDRKEAKIAPTPDSVLTFTGGASKEDEMAPSPDSVLAFTGGASKEAEMAPSPDSVLIFTGGASKEAEMAPSPDSVLTFTGGPSKGAEMVPAPNSALSLTGGASKGTEMAPVPNSVLTFTGGPSKGAEMAPSLNSALSFTGGASKGTEMVPAPESVFIFSGNVSKGAEIAQALIKRDTVYPKRPFAPLIRFSPKKKDVCF